MVRSGTRTTDEVNEKAGQTRLSLFGQFPRTRPGYCVYFHNISVDLLGSREFPTPLWVVVGRDSALDEVAKVVVTPPLHIVNEPHFDHNSIPRIDLDKERFVVIANIRVTGFITDLRVNAAVAVPNRRQVREINCKGEWRHFLPPSLCTPHYSIRS